MLVKGSHLSIDLCIYHRKHPLQRDAWYSIPSIYQSAHLTIYLYTYLCINLSIYIHLSIYLCIYPRKYPVQRDDAWYSMLSIYLYIYPSIYLSIYPRKHPVQRDAWYSIPSIWPRGWYCGGELQNYHEIHHWAYWEG